MKIGVTMLQIERLTRRFGSKTAVDGVSLRIPAGQMVGVIGRSGAGKSTLLRMINRLTEPSEGRIIFDGQDVTQLKGRALRDWRMRSAMIFQQFNLVQRLDVLTNVLVGRLNQRPMLSSMFKMFTAEERAMALTALDRFDLAEAASRHWNDSEQMQADDKENEGDKIICVRPDVSHDPSGGGGQSANDGDGDQNAGGEQQGNPKGAFGGNSALLVNKADNQRDRSQMTGT